LIVNGLTEGKQQSSLNLLFTFAGCRYSIYRDWSSIRNYGE